MASSSENNSTSIAMNPPSVAIDMPVQADISSLLGKMLPYINKKTRMVLAQVRQLRKNCKKKHWFYFLQAFGGIIRSGVDVKKLAKSDGIDVVQICFTVLLLLVYEMKVNWLKWINTIRNNNYNILFLFLACPHSPGYFFAYLHHFNCAGVQEGPAS